MGDGVLAQLDDVDNGDIKRRGVNFGVLRK